MYSSCYIRNTGRFLKDKIKAEYVILDKNSSVFLEIIYYTCTFILHRIQYIFVHKIKQIASKVKFTPSMYQVAIQFHLKQNN